MNAHDYLSAYYADYDEDGRLLTRYGHVEFLTTMTYIGKYLRPGMRILEIGAGTGRYSHALARQGYRIDAVELLACNIDLFKKNTQEGRENCIKLYRFTLKTLGKIDEEGVVLVLVENSVLPLISLVFGCSFGEAEEFTADFGNAVNTLRAVLTLNCTCDVYLTPVH